jgi:hypothetical protein
VRGGAVEDLPFFLWWGTNENLKANEIFDPNEICFVKFG